MRLLKRLEKMEQQVNVSNAFPVVIIRENELIRVEDGILLVVPSEKEMEQYKNRINKDTVIIIDNIPDDDEVTV
ncbi:hypothetical protein [Pseudalkalibacillus decolorationis]|uniref:hypothetical protein n=1 Tax=Pseudalkalibacillus decolorationis TaxID=163879 RepID=UPI00214775B2|nr:hypothetical protein [Pseudalkalibacillus decolorationis]